ncbi:MAG: sensor domain-containing diguanylate cyclase [Chloroflexi bacterium]|nr:sensor domain-containing diguanylate cyclase [Chloroflexota bacterium]
MAGGLGVLAYALAERRFSAVGSAWALGAFAVATECLPIRLPRANYVSITFLPVILAFLLVGPAEALVVLGIGALVGSGIVHRLHLWNSLALANQNMFAAAVAWWVFDAIRGLGLGFSLAEIPILGLLGYAVTFSLANLVLQRWRGQHKEEPIAAELSEPHHLSDLTTNLFLLPMAASVLVIYRAAGLISLIFTLLILLMALAIFRFYINLDTAHQEITALYEVSRELGTSLSITETLQLAIESASRLVNADHCHGFLVNHKKRQLFPISDGREHPGSGPSPETMLSPQEERMLYQLALTGKAEVLPLFGVGAEAEGKKPRPRRSLLALPLGKDGEPVAVLTLAKDNRTFSAQEIALLSILRNQANVALKNAQLYEDTERLARTDGLTGLFNQRTMRELLDSEIKRAERFSRSLSMIMIDLDFFKKVNDQYGHEAGNQVLKGLAGILTASVRDVDIVARYGGEEFAVVLPEADEAQARLVAERIQQGVADNVFEPQPGLELRLTVSQGVATFPVHANSAGEVIVRADEALYAAKQGGRNLVCLAAPRST